MGSWSEESSKRRSTLKTEMCKKAAKINKLKTELVAGIACRLAKRVYTQHTHHHRKHTHTEHTLIAVYIVLWSALFGQKTWQTELGSPQRKNRRTKAELIRKRLLVEPRSDR